MEFDEKLSAPESIEFTCPVILDYQAKRSDVPTGEDELT